MSEEKKKFSLSPKQKSALTHALAIILSILAAGFGMPLLADLGKAIEVVAPVLEAQDSDAKDSDAKPEAAPAAPADTAAPVAPPAEEKAPEAAPA